jgi:regulatory protein
MRAATGSKSKTRRAAAVSPERAQDAEACREAALKLLERTRRTRADLTRRLAEKGYATPVVHAVLERLSGVGLIDDAEYARAFLTERWGRRAAGWRRLEQELRRRGIAGDDIAHARAAFEAERGSADEVGLARRVIAQAARRYAALEPRVRRQRLYALLVRRGFEGETIDQALKTPDTNET